MTVLALIPARGGSKGIPHKNRVILGGKPLLWYTAKAALKAKRVSIALLSTDNPGLMRLGRRLGLQVPFRRPPTLASDRAPMLGVVQHALRFWEKQTGHPVDAVVLLQPTSPFRTARHVDQAIALFKRTRADAVVSVQPVPHAFSVASQMKMSAGWLKPAVPGRLVLDRHSKPAFVARNGPAILVLSRKQVLRGNFYSGRTRAFEMSAEDSIDIDTPRDLTFARLALKPGRP